MTPDELRKGLAAELIRTYRLIVVLRRIEPGDQLLALVDELADIGAHIFEVTFDSRDAATGLRACSGRLAQRRDGPFLVGAGTVRTPEQLLGALDAGAAFAASPTFDRALVGKAIDAGLPFVPGTATPTEADHAWRCGATFVKIFPAAALGASFIRELRGPLPEVEIIATGGLHADNARDFLDAGAIAVGVGSALVNTDAAARRALVASVRSWSRSPHG